MDNQVKLITDPTVIVLGGMALYEEGLNELVDWVGDYRPECLPDGLSAIPSIRAMALFPHTGMEHDRALTDNELLVELAGRSCYHSYGLKAGRKDNSAYIAHAIFPEDPKMIPHASIGYHAKMTFFIAGISRRVSHELIRHYVGADRDEEGSPSQESTRYTEHPGHFVVPPRVLAAVEREFAETPKHDLGWAGLAIEAGLAPSQHDMPSAKEFRTSMEDAYANYRSYITHEVNDFATRNRGEVPKGMDRKRIYEAAAGLLPMQACTSLVWTTNPMALNKLFRERDNEAADLEFARLAKKWRKIATDRWPNLFQG